ncbi:MAG: hypothetical protein JW982_05970 [Spirochaetes bacterium]|nr:hypothetical protein [Spirochaetota bacterium]
MKKLACCLIVFFAAGSFAGAASIQDKIQEGIRYHDLALLDPSNIKKAKEILEPLQNVSALAKGYYGSVITQEAGEYAKNKNGIKALALLSDGTKLIDEAVNMDPDIPDLHFLRMINSYQVSEGSPVNRYKIMKTDIDWLLKRQSNYSSKNQGIIQLYSGLYYLKARRLSEALAAFDACIAISPGSAEAAEAKKHKARYAE